MKGNYRLIGMMPITYNDEGFKKIDIPLRRLEAKADQLQSDINEILKQMRDLDFKISTGKRLIQAYKAKHGLWSIASG